jgi:hypothetical protein
MPIIPKRIKNFTNKEINIDDMSFKALNDLGLKHGQSIWSGNNHSAIGLTVVESQLVSTFKSNIKDYLFATAQGRYCCYCGCILEKHKATYDLEHIICKNNNKKVIFHIRNLALACKPCNISKHTKKVTLETINENDDLIYESNTDYIIVHPHFDDWGNHLSIDKYNRVVVNNSSNKGETTIKICGISKKNAMSLSDFFDIFKQSPDFLNNWIDFYSIYESKEDNQKKTKYKKFLSNLLSLDSDPAAKEIIQLLNL